MVDKSVVVIKTHMLPSDIFDKAVLIVGDPFDALVTEWNRQLPVKSDMHPEVVSRMTVGWNGNAMFTRGSNSGEILTLHGTTTLLRRVIYMS